MHPTFTAVSEILPALRARGYALLSPETVAQWLSLSHSDFSRFRHDWDTLPPDAHLKDGGRYRRRRHASFVVTPNEVELVAHRAHWQPVSYNALHGGMLRWFDPMLATTVAQPAWKQLLAALGVLSTSLHPDTTRWYVEAHQFRIDTTDGIGRPTPEGAHRDGVDLVAIFLVDRVGVKGGETRVFEADGPHGERFTLTQPWSLLLLDDARVIHETTPIQPVDAPGHRDTLVVTLRADSFQNES
jgi:hypothetical protein